MAGLVTNVDGDQATSTTVATTPANDSFVAVYVNGVRYQVGDGVKTTDCYFSNDSGTTARNWADIESGDTLHWNRTVAGFKLDTNDVIDFDYDTG
jgi:hypothetical protein